MSITLQLKTTLGESRAPLRTGKGHASLSHARKAVGQAQRLAQLVPEAQTWAAALWAVLTAAMRANEAPAGRGEPPPGRLPCSRFASAARWFSVLIEVAILPVQRIVTPPDYTYSGTAGAGHSMPAAPERLRRHQYHNRRATHQREIHDTG